MWAVEGFGERGRPTALASLSEVENDFRFGSDAGENRQVERDFVQEMSVEGVRGFVFCDGYGMEICVAVRNIRADDCFADRRPELEDSDAFALSVKFSGQGVVRRVALQGSTRRCILLTSSCVTHSDHRPTMIFTALQSPPVFTNAPE